MRSPLFALPCVCSAALAVAQVVSYEGTSFPENDGWVREEPGCSPEREIISGWLVMDMELGCFPPPSGGDQDIYTHSISEFDQNPRFFVEYLVFPDGPSSEMPWGSPAVMSAWSQGPVFYYFQLSRDKVRLYRGNKFPAPFISVDSTIPHRHRLEIYGTTFFAWYVDGQVVDSGIPEAQYPSYNPSISWSGRAAHFPVTVAWDFVRYGQIPLDGSFDYDTSGAIDEFDLYFFQECFLDPAIQSWPGCKFADFNSDGLVDCADWAAFVAGWDGPVPPSVELCPPGPLIPTASHWAAACLTLLLVTGGTLVFGRSVGATIRARSASDGSNRHVAGDDWRLNDVRGSEPPPQWRNTRRGEERRGLTAIESVYLALHPQHSSRRWVVN